MAALLGRLVQTEISQQQLDGLHSWFRGDVRHKTEAEIKRWASSFIAIELNFMQMMLLAGAGSIRLFRSLTITRFVNDLCTTNHKI